MVFFPVNEVTLKHASWVTLSPTVNEAYYRNCQLTKIIPNYQ